MELLSTAIKFRDFMTLVMVWELRHGYWEILSIVRLSRAIALARESPTTRLVFPTGVFPNGVWGGIYKHRATKINPNKVDTLQERRERVLQLLSKSPGQTREAMVAERTAAGIAPQLGVSVATAGQLLRHLEKSGDIHHRAHPMQNKTKLYYAGTAPTNSNPGAASKNPSKSVRSTPTVPPLKVYFVDPRTLQQTNQ